MQRQQFGLEMVMTLLMVNDFEQPLRKSHSVRVKISF